MQEVYLLPGTMYLRPDNSTAIVADPNPTNEDGSAQTPNQPPTWTSYVVMTNEDGSRRISPLNRSSLECPNDVVKILVTLGRDELIGMVSPTVSDSLKTLIQEEYYECLARGPRRVVIPHLPE